MIKAIFKKLLLRLFLLTDGAMGLLGLLFIIICYAITFLISIFYKPTLNLIGIMTIVFTLIILYIRRPSNIEGRLYRFRETMEYKTDNLESLLIKLDKIMAKMNTCKKNKHSSNNYYTAISHKSHLLMLLGAKEFKVSILEEAIKLNNELINHKEINYKHNNVLCYKYIAQITNNEEYLERSIDICKNIIDNNSANINTYTLLASCYEIISDYYWPEEHLNHAIEILEIASKMPNASESTNNITLERIKGKVYRKLYEINKNDLYKELGIISSNTIITYYIKNNKHMKIMSKLTYYQNEHVLGSAYYDLYKLTGKEETCQSCKNHLLDAKQYFALLGKQDLIVDIDKMLNTI